MGHHLSSLGITIYYSPDLGTAQENVGSWQPLSEYCLDVQTRGSPDKNLSQAIEEYLDDIKAYKPSKA